MPDNIGISPRNFVSSNQKNPFVIGQKSLSAPRSSSSQQSSGPQPLKSQGISRLPVQNNTDVTRFFAARLLSGSVSTSPYDNQSSLSPQFLRKVADRLVSPSPVNNLASLFDRENSRISAVRDDLNEVLPNDNDGLQTYADDLETELHEGLSKLQNGLKSTNLSNYNSTTAAMLSKPAQN